MVADTQVTLPEAITLVPGQFEGGYRAPLRSRKSQPECMRVERGMAASEALPFPQPFTRYNGHICMNDDTNDDWESERCIKIKRKRRRAYHRLLTGLHYHRGKRIRFLTLTLVRDSNNDIHECFRVFKERIRRLTPNKLMKQDVEGFFTLQKMKQYFGNSDKWDKRIKFEYFSVNVFGKRQHMHILYFGDWLPHAWLKKVWKEITGDSDVVDIRTTQENVNDVKVLASYVLAQYTLLQDGDIRFQMSHGWTWRGMVRDWKLAVKRFTKHKKGRYVVDFSELLGYWSIVVKERKTSQTGLTVI